MKTLIGLILSSFITVGCYNESVDWENYHPQVKQRIDSLAKQGDCAGLQAQFEMAEALSSAQKARTRDGNADLMGYIDQKLEEAGCSL